MMESHVEKPVSPGVTEGGCGLNTKSSGAFRSIEFFFFSFSFSVSEACHAAAELRRKAPRRLFRGFLGRFTAAALGLACVWTPSQTAVEAFKDYKFRTPGDAA